MEDHVNRVGGFGKRCLGAALLLACTLWVTADVLIGIPGLRQPSITVRVPHLVGRLFTDGQLPDTAHFTPSVTYVYDDHAPRTILSQTPAADAVRKITPGGEPYPLSLVVSLGRREITLPDTRGMEARVAKNLLTAKGLTVILSSVTLMDGEARHTPAHAVLDMDPAPGTVVGDADRVTLYVAEPLTDHGVCCPDVVGLSLPEAIARLIEGGLQIGEVVTAETNAFPDDSNIPYNPWIFHPYERTETVKAQNRPSGCYLPRGTTISLVIS